MSQEQLGRYRILEKVAAGTQGTVFRAFDAESGHLVALKVLHPAMTGDDSYLDRFHREASLASSIDHPNVVQIFDVGEDGDRHFIALEFLPENLARLIESGGFPVERAARLGVGIADGLGEIHALGIVHRDMKPQNVLITPDGTPKVTDFGIARTEEVSSMTATGALMGTPYYMSPEQARGEPADSRSDVYAVGCIIYEMLTGEVPFDAPTPLAVIRQQIEQDPRPVRSLRDNVPRAFAQVIERAMHKDPGQRYLNGADLAMAIRQAIPGLRTEQTSTYGSGGSGGSGGSSRVGTSDPRRSFTPFQQESAGSSLARKVATRTAVVLGILIGGAVIGIVAVASLQGGVELDPGTRENGPGPVVAPTATPDAGTEGVSGDDTSAKQATDPTSAPGLEPLSDSDAEQILSRLSTGATAVAEASAGPTRVGGDTTPDEPSPTPTAQPVATATSVSGQEPTPTLTPVVGSTISPTPTPTPAPKADPIAAWQLQKPFTFDSLDSVVLLPDNKIIIADDHGYIWISNDGGETWSSDRTGAGCGFTDFTILSDSSAIAVDECGAGLIRTAGSGGAWEPVTLDLLDSQSVGSLFFLNENVGWVSGSSGLLSKTTDGGRTWNRINIPTRSFIEVVNFVSEDVGWVGGLSGTLLATADGGVSWERIRTPQNCQIRSIAVRGTLIWAAGNCEQVMFSGDGGVTWADRSAQSWGVDLEDIEFLDEQTAWITGRIYDPERSILLKTTDGGKNWDRATDELPGILRDLAVTITDNGPIGWAVGSSGLALKLVPHDAAIVQIDPDALESQLSRPANRPERVPLPELLNWVGQDEFTFDSLFALSISENGSVLIGGDGGAIYRADPDDESFAIADLNNGCATSQIQYVSALEAVALDSCGGAMYKSTDSGQDWESINENPFPDSGIVASYFIDRNTGWISGWDGSFARTDNAGRSWQKLRIPTHSGLETIFFADENHGWIGGLNNAMLRTRDGGESWEKVETPRGVCRIVSISGNMPVLWALDECNGVFVSTDSGDSWEYRDTPNNINSRVITMWDSDTAWIGGESNDSNQSSILVTRDGGSHWQLAFDSEDNSGSISDIQVADTSAGPVGWAVGPGGLIVRLGVGK
ncbi:MAG: protein kinase [Chloroflexi bacterium]|nr:protein kinase [Chloroflexota bacterium]